VGALEPFALDCKQRHYAAQACFSGVSADLASLAVRRCDPLLLGAAQDSAQFLRRDFLPHRRAAGQGNGGRYSSSGLPGLSAGDLASLEQVFKHVEKIFNPSEERI
jgi:hypothetical protein